MIGCRMTVTALLAVGWLTITAVPAEAERTTVVDGVDAPSGLLDISRLTIMNRDRAVVVELAFVDDVPGDILVNLDARHRGRPGLGDVSLSSEHRRRGPDHAYLSVSGNDVRCSRLTSDWRRRAATLTLRMPARCMRAGNYRAVRGTAITFTTRWGQDVDFAPNLVRGGETYTRWVPRG
jgi:hypothetical protein